MILTLEKAIMRGKPVLLRNCEEHIDNIITPLMYHRNTANENDSNEDRLLALLSRRLIGELIVYPCSGVRPSSVRPSFTNSKIFFSETAGPIVLILHIHHLQVGGKNNCVFMPPTSWKLRGYIGLGLSVQSNPVSL